MTDYFSGGAAGEGSPRIVRARDARRFTIAPGIDIAPLLGARMNLNLVTLAPGAVAAVHVHDEEQLGVVVGGSCTFSDGTTTWELDTGDMYQVAPGVPHGATAGTEGCVILDAFAPPRAGIAELFGG
jgi:quercetin dioxygenase-like cupin family protein